METFKIAFGIVRSEFGKWKKNAKIITVFFLLLILLLVYLGKIPRFCLKNDMTCTPFLISLLFSGGLNSNGSFKVLFFFIAILLYSSAPFLDQQTFFMIIRTGRRKWLFGELMYVVITALLLTMLLWTAALLSTSACVETDPSKWGSLPMNAYADPSICRDYGVLNGYVLDEKMLSMVHPGSSSAYVTLYVFLDLVLLALTVWAGNVWMPKRNLGIMTAAFLVLFDPVIFALTGASARFLQIFSPISWCSLNFYRSVCGMGVLNLRLVFLLYLGWYAALLGLIIYRTEKMDITVYMADRG